MTCEIKPLRKSVLCLSKGPTPTTIGVDGGNRDSKKSLKRGKFMNTWKDTQLRPCPEDGPLGSTTLSTDR